MSLDDPIALAVRCRTCGVEHAPEVGALLFDPEPVLGDAPDKWSAAIYVPLSITCPGCGAVDAHEVSPEAGRAVAERAAAGVDAEGTVTVREGRAALSDGTPIRTPSEGLTLLRERAEARPADPLGWRRLGNFALRADRHEEAMDAFRRGAALDGELECAIAVAADEVARESAGAFEAVARALARLPRADPRRRPLQAAQLVEAARRLGEGHLHVPRGAIDVSAVRDWSRLGELLTSHAVDSIELAREPHAPPIDVRAALRG